MFRRDESSMKKGNPLIILISGKARSGKDTSGNFLYELLKNAGKRVSIAHYGDFLKFICHNFYGTSYDHTPENRTTWQRIGTERVRIEMEDPNFWVSIMESMISIVAPDFDYIIIPDARFPNEIEIPRVFGWNVVTLRVERPGFESNLTAVQKAHISETALDNYAFDYIIEASNIEELKADVNMFYEEITYPNFSVIQRFGEIKPKEG